MAGGDAATLCADAGGGLRGPCRACPRCRAWTPPPRGPAAAEAAQAAEAAAAACACCGCAADGHEDLAAWAAEVRHWLRVAGAGVTVAGSAASGAPEPAVPLPSAGRRWEPAAAGLYAATRGRFDPARHGRAPTRVGGAPAPAVGGYGGTAAERAPAAVSVVCATTERQHPSHGLLYECFRRQSQERRELVVVDTGTRPSEFLLAKAFEDPSLIYRFFHREEHGAQREEDRLARALQEDDQDEVLQWVHWTPDVERAEAPHAGWPRGLKLNVACHLAQGSTVAVFTAGDLYAEDYLRHIRRELMASAARPAGGLRPAGVALAEWHGFDVAAGCFRLLRAGARGERSLRLQSEKFQDLQCSHGFTFAFTRAAWLQRPFPHVDEPELEVWRAHAMPLRLVGPRRAVEDTAGKSSASAEEEGSDESEAGADAWAVRVFDRRGALGAHAAASINLSAEVDEFISNSREVGAPTAVEGLLPMFSALVARGARQQEKAKNDFLREHGATFFCARCDAAVALRKYLREGAQSLRFSRAGGAVAEGPQHRRLSEHGWDTSHAELRRRAATVWPSSAPPALAAGIARPQRERWRVVGGLESGGIMVREDAALTSPLLPQRLAAGAVFEEQERVDGRLRFSRLAGEGPDVGWVSIIAKDKILVERFVASATEAQAPLPGAFGPRPTHSWHPPVVCSEHQWAAPGGPCPPIEALEDSAWRKAICRHCAAVLGRRCECEGFTSWELDVESLRERPPPAGEAQPPPGRVAPAAGTAAADEPGPAAPPEAVDETLPLLRKALAGLSPELQAKLGRVVQLPGHARLGSCLDELRSDAATRARLRQELQLRRDLVCEQAERLVEEAFKERLSTLRALGSRALRDALRAAGSLAPTSLAEFGAGPGDAAAEPDEFQAVEGPAESPQGVRDSAVAAPSGRSHARGARHTGGGRRRELEQHSCGLRGGNAREAALSLLV